MQSSKNKQIPNLELINLTKELSNLLLQKDLTLFQISDAYFELSKIVYDLLENYRSDIKILELGYFELIKLIANIQKKPVERLKDESLLDNAKDNVRTSWNRLISNMNFLVNEIQNLRNKKYKKITIYISFFALGISAISLFVSFLF